MKQELLVLIDQIDKIRKLAHSEVGSFPLDFVLYDVDEFVDWKQKIKFELIAIPNPDQYIADTLNLVNAEYNGFEDKHQHSTYFAGVEWLYVTRTYLRHGHICIHINYYMVLFF